MYIFFYYFKSFYTLEDVRAMHNYNGVLRNGNGMENLMPVHLKFLVIYIVL